MTQNQTIEAAAGSLSPTGTSQAPGTTGLSASGGIATRGAARATLLTPKGRTTIADVVVSKIAGIAAREVSGVHGLGGGAARAVGALRERIPGASINHSQGVSVEVGEKQAAVDIEIVAEYGVSIADLASGIRQNVIFAVEQMTGLEVTEVNVTVHDVFLDDAGAADADTPSRVL